MFLEHFKLESNPFAPRQVRPRLQSTAGRSAFVKLGRVIDGSLHCLFLSGRAGIGKSTLVERYIKEQNGIVVSLVSPSIVTATQFLNKVLRDVGLPTIEASTTELRHILEVYLRHQASKNARIVLVADPLERLAEPVLAELESLMNLRYKGRPLMSFVLLARSQELVQELLPATGGTPLARHAHERVAGFTLDETSEYIMTCLHSVGCEYVDALISETVVRDIYAFTGGVVADINRVCFEALNLLADEPKSDVRCGLDSALVTRAAKSLNLRYDPAFWRDIEDALSPESIHQSDPTELTVQAAQLLVTSRGKVVAEITLNRPRMVLGRDQSCDISLDSSYVSRYQNLFMETAGGWLLIDLSSTNGCFVNGRRIAQHELQDGDIIAVGHHQLSFVGPGGRKAEARSDLTPIHETDDGNDTLVSPTPIGQVESA